MSVFSLPMLGQPMPELNVNTTKGRMTLPKDFKGKWIVLFSHPADFTPVCTTEFVAFQKRWTEFEELNAVLIGLSVDQVFSHIKWIDWMNEKLSVDIKFPVIADERGTMAEQLGMLHPGKGNNTVRAVFLIDPAGVLRLLLYYPPEVGRNMDEILRALKALQIADANKCAMPANWPNNELIGDRVIVPPAANADEAKTRLKEYDGFDWWFCHKSLK